MGIFVSSRTYKPPVTVKPQDVRFSLEQKDRLTNVLRKIFGINPPLKEGGRVGALSISNLSGTFLSDISHGLGLLELPMSGLAVTFYTRNGVDICEFSARIKTPQQEDKAYLDANTNVGRQLLCELLDIVGQHVISELGNEMKNCQIEVGAYVFPRNYSDGDASYREGSYQFAFQELNLETGLTNTFSEIVVAGRIELAAVES